MNVKRSYFHWFSESDTDEPTAIKDDEVFFETKKMIRIEIKEGRSNFSVELEKEEAERLARDLLLQLGQTPSFDILADIVHEKKVSGEEW